MSQPTNADTATGTEPKITLKAIKEFFGYPTLQAFSADWKLLSDASKTQLKTGIANGTFTY